MGGGEERAAFCRCEDVNGSSDGLPEVANGTGGDALQDGFDLGDGHRDWIEVGAVCRQEAELGPALSIASVPLKARDGCEKPCAKLSCPIHYLLKGTVAYFR